MATPYSAKDLTTQRLPDLYKSRDPIHHTTWPSKSNQEFIGLTGQWPNFENKVRRTVSQNINLSNGALTSSLRYSIKSPLQERTISTFFDG